MQGCRNLQTLFGNMWEKCTTSWHQVAQVTKFWAVAPNIFGPAMWNLLHVTLLKPGILRWLLNIWKICASILYGFTSINSISSYDSRIRNFKMANTKVSPYTVLNDIQKLSSSQTHSPKSILNYILQFLYNHSIWGLPIPFPAKTLWALCHCTEYRLTASEINYPNKHT